MLKPELCFYCVMFLETGKIAYSGNNLNKAADALVPGTCFGKGHTPRLALDAAHRFASQLDFSTSPRS